MATSRNRTASGHGVDSSRERGFSNMNGEQEQSMKLEDLQANAAVRGILSDGLVTVVSVQWFGSEGMCCNFQKSARERLVGSTRLRLMQPLRTAC